MENKRYAIENTSGQWWCEHNGWTAKQGASDYALDELPETIIEKDNPFNEDGPLALEKWTEDPKDYIYYNKEDKGTASVRPIGPR